MGKSTVAITDGGIEVGSEYPLSSLAKKAENIDQLPAKTRGADIYKIQETEEANSFLFEMK